MKRILVVALTAGLVAGALVAPAEAGKKKKKKPQKVTREVVFDYVCPCIGRYQFGGATGTNLGGGPVSVGLESYLTAVAVDDSGQPVHVAINQDTNGDGFNDDVGEFCGETTEPMPINPGLEIRVFVGDPQPGCPGPALGGTITFQLSNLP